MSKAASSKIKSKLYHIATFAFITLAFFNTANAQSGDQILDGIGETGLSARYIFDGNLKDWSRNKFHGTSLPGGVNFVNDARFGKVLSLSGDANAFINLPDAVLNDLESISLSGWVFLRSKQAGQPVFDFGMNGTKHFYTLTTLKNQTAGLTTAIVSEKNLISAVSPSTELNNWIHLAVVIDIPSKTLITYINGKPAGQAVDSIVDLSEVIASSQSKDKNKLYIGKSFIKGSPNLNASLHDFRIYRVALSGKQVDGIFRNADQGSNGQVSTTAKPEDDLPHFAMSQPQLYNAGLISVSDITVKTTVGTLPRLPAFIDAVYKNNAIGPKVRVIWPTPIDNSSVLKPGTYSVTGHIPGTSFKPRATVSIETLSSTSTPKLKLSAFKLNQVALKTDADGHETKFIENRDKFINTLAKTDPNSFLYMFRHAFGQTQPDGAQPLGVWDTEDTKLRGHATGHYLSAIAQAYAGTEYDPELHKNFANKMEYMVNTLYDLSQQSGKPQKTGGAFNADPTKVPAGPGKTDFDSDLATGSIRNDYWNWGTGFISAYPPDQFIMLERGAKYGGQKNQIWAPYYTLHKILAGLIDVYEVSGNKKALAIATNMSDWVFARLNHLPQETLIKMWNTYIAGEYGGMNESMAHLYQITKKPEHLKTAQLFDNIKVFYGDTAHSHGLAKNVDIFRGLHANQHIPQIVGSIEVYRASNNPEYYKIADNFWHKMIDGYMYSIGGVAGARNPANAECFIAQPATLYENGFSEGGQNETCATYNMLKLTGDLFLYDQSAELMDYYERGLYNHILASVAENSPANTYHVPLRPGSLKQFGNSDMTGFTCCNGTAIESSTKLQNSIYFKSKDNQALFVNLYVPSVLDWTEKKIQIEQITDFPKKDETKLIIRGKGKFDVNVRVPGWASKGFFVKINGLTQNVDAKPGSYIKLSRNWKNNDIIELKMPFTFYLDPVMDQQNIASLFYGPILLAAQEPEARKDWRKITLDANDISKSIKGNPEKLQFTIGNAVFKPFYNTYGRHSVYLDVTLK
ncbi:MAG: beta-L-arabinofuranosidase domain-containing protein [Pedobacter agri]